MLGCAKPPKGFLTHAFPPAPCSESPCAASAAAPSLSPRHPPTRGSPNNLDLSRLRGVVLLCVCTVRLEVQGLVSSVLRAHRMCFLSVLGSELNLLVVN